MQLNEMASWRILHSKRISELLTNKVFLIKGRHEDERCLYFQNQLTADSPVVSITYDLENSKIMLTFDNLDNEPDLLDEEDPVMKSDLLVEFIIQQGINIVLDMTSIPTEVLFLLMKSFHDENFDDFSIVYVQPDEYLKQEQDIGLMSEFQLSEEHSPISAIPGFLRLPEEEKEPLLVVFIGFEGGRFQELFEHIVTDGPVDIIPILPMPSFTAGWHMVGIYQNLQTLKTADILTEIRRVTAWDPFHALSLLDKHYELRQESNQIIVAPLGTKPHTLATVLFAIKHSNVRIMYDHPRVSGNRSKGIGKIRGYTMKIYLKKRYFQEIEHGEKLYKVLHSYKSSSASN
ncbi:hypothetical protein [Paenibacillus sp. HGF5]|uniref:hypothetical protein n=1 Tax=Paenibacillus sp. HGF5 TaxID=908341 RepID=UPI0002072791|nr:hypothetical protein [Paenibacillus sp. HGF5]EGG34824.1 hypothetical protein HMPREF9412_3755 [Paenibacillus sp. HGF5]